VTRSLIILPDDSAQPVLEAVSAATRSIRIKMFAFTHLPLIDALAGAHHRGVAVKVMLNPVRRDGRTDNDAARDLLQYLGIAVTSSSPAFGLTHEKSMVIDDQYAIIGSPNWTDEDLTETRDYAIITQDPAEVAEIVAGFEADWAREVFDPGQTGRLIWCPTNGRARLAQFIDEATTSLYVQNERYDDPVIIDHLVRAARRGVTVHVMARMPHHRNIDKLTASVSGLRALQEAGIDIHQLKHLKLHAKMILADHQRAVVGSIVLSPGSFDDRRDLAIEVHDDAVVARLREVAQHDWTHSTPIELSDTALSAGLAERRERHDVDQLSTPAFDD
jgi:cardiolipin synthase A/B